MFILFVCGGAAWMADMPRYPLPAPDLLVTSIRYNQHARESLQALPRRGREPGSSPQRGEAGRGAMSANVPGAGFLKEQHTMRMCAESSQKARRGLHPGPYRALP